LWKNTVMDATSTVSQVPLRRMKTIVQLDSELTRRFNDRLRTQRELNRQIVSFQANRERPGYRWYKYKEAFSASLVEYLFAKYTMPEGPVLDPFAGTGTTLF